MHEAIKLEEKYERNGWPSLARPDLEPPPGWSLSLITAVDRVRSHPRCPMAIDVCRSVDLALLGTSPDRAVACVRVESSFDENHRHK